MTAHRTKTAALIAYAEGLLSVEGCRRLEAHLAQCDACESELAAIRLYETMVEDVREGPVPAIDFGKMELTLARQAEQVSRAIRARALRRRALPWLGLAAAAAVGVAFWAWPRTPEAPLALPTPPIEETPLPAPLVEAAVLIPTVTLAAGVAQRIDDGERALVPGDVLGEEARLRTGEDGELHVRLHEGTGIRLAASTQTGLTRIREGEIALTLSRGTLASEVAPLRGQSTFIVLCAGYEVEARGANVVVSYVVSYLEEVLTVDLSDGSVVIRDPGGHEINLESPARWSSAGPVGGEPSAAAVRSAHAPVVEPTLVTLSDIRLVRWELDGVDISTLGDVRLGLVPGEHRVRGWDARGRLFTTLLPVGDAPVMLEPGAMRSQAPHMQPGHLDPEDIQRVLGRGMRQVRRCYEVSLRQGETTQGHAQLRITVGLLGGVETARVMGIDDAPLAQCIENYASRWIFPPPGGPVTLEQPLNLTPTQ